MKQKRILVTGAGAPGGPGIIRALQQEKQFRIYAGDMNVTASGRFLCDEFIQLPGADERERFISVVFDYCLTHRIDAVLPLVTKELFLFSEQKNNFANAGVQVIVSDHKSLYKANNKGQTYGHLSANGLSVPSYFIVSSVTELEAAAKQLGYPAQPICVKPTVANGSRGVRILQEDVDEYDLWLYHKPNHLYSSLTKLTTMLNGKPFPELLVSDYLPGEEVSVDTIVQHGQPKVILPRSRERMVNGISVQGKFTKDDDIIAYSKAVLESFYFSGPIGLQLKQDSQGMYQLLEINPRLQGTSCAALGIGINLPVLAVQQAFGEVVIDESKIAWGTSFVRYYDELFYTY